MVVLSIPWILLYFHKPQIPMDIIFYLVTLFIKMTHKNIYFCFEILRNDVENKKK